jgi:putative spermidine/putrescine transport system substrate-binding protein
VPGAVQPCGVGIFVWTTLLAYNQDKVQGKPASWADFWDVKKYPGKRGLRWGAKQPGVRPDGRWRGGQGCLPCSAPGRASIGLFRKLDELKPYIHWWKSGQDGA